MSRIKSLMAVERIAEVEYPGIPDFKVQLRYLTREELTKMRNACLVTKFNKRTHQREAEVDSDKFTKLYADKVLVNWSGLKVKHLSEFIPVELVGVELEEDIPFSKEEAIDLMLSSTVFDAFITDAMGDISTFEESKKEEEEKN